MFRLHALVLAVGGFVDLVRNSRINMWINRSPGASGDILTKAEVVNV